MAVIGAGFGEACRQKLNTGMTLQKSMIVMSYPAFALQLQQYFENLVVIDPANPGEAESGIVGRLKAIDAQQNAKKALLALGTGVRVTHLYVR
ncbi:MAG TPA: hypothetical protein VME17_19190 [Bryobacteraceae bacterium]|nr:hypothetical protein [Bryobacteraceae bacterium]